MCVQFANFLSQTNDLYAYIHTDTRKLIKEIGDTRYVYTKNSKWSVAGCSQYEDSYKMD